LKRVLIAALLALPIAAVAQTDLQGIWQAKGNAYLDLEKFVAPPGSKIPYRVDALAKRQDNFERRETADTVKKCYLPGVPRITLLPMPFQIFQSGPYVAIVYRYAHAYRTIYVDGTKHLDGVDFWMGDSRGHWEGNTLVVDTTNFTDKTRFRGASENLHLIERFTRSDPDTILYEFTVEDPATFTKPWTAQMTLSKTPGRIYEYACQEGNYSMVGILSGARAEEKDSK